MSKDTIKTTDDNVTSGDLAAALAKLAEALPSLKTQGFTPEQFEQVLDKQERKTNPSVAVSPGISVFSHPKGDLEQPKDKLGANEVFENGFRLREDQLTPLEIASYNAVIAKLPKAGDRLVAWNGKLKAWRADDGHRVLITFPSKSIEDLADANAQTIVYRNRALTDGESAANPNTVLEELMAAKARIAALEAKTA
jgi:hypothetical protein